MGLCGRSDIAMNRKQRRASAKNAEHVGYLAGDKLIQRSDGSYLLTLRQAILVTLEAHTKPARAVSRFVDTLAETCHGRKASQAEKIDIFEAWLKGGVKGEDAVATSLLQTLAERLHAAAPELMNMLYALARYKPSGTAPAEAAP